MISLCYSNFQTERGCLSVYHPYKTLPSPQGLFNYQHRLRWDMFQENFPICIPSPQGRIRWATLFTHITSTVSAGTFLQHLFITQSPQGQFKTFIYNAVSAGTISIFIYNAVSAGTIYNIYLLTSLRRDDLPCNLSEFHCLPACSNEHLTV
jgi:hypothetical protein